MQSGKSKLGRFLFFIGLILLVIFFTIDQAAHPTYGYLCAGVVVVLLGAVLMLRGQAPPPDDSMRFRTLRRWREQQKERKADRKKKPFER
jgi:peptidoglycan/LPS O-acetylase OafA/YrhL